MNPAIRYHDKVLERAVIPAIEFTGGEDYTHFRQPRHIHSFTVAFGLPEIKFACHCAGTAEALFDFKPAKSSASREPRYYLKLNACWKIWEKYEHPAEILINGKTLYKDFLFLENTCKGWPSLYFKIPAGFLSGGKNSLVIKNLSGGENSIMLHKAEILRYPDKIHMTVRSCPDFASAGKRFNIMLSLLREEKAIDVSCPGGLAKFEGRDGERFNFTALKASKNVKITFKAGKKTVSCSVPEIFSSSDDKVFVGMDYDDYRQDNTEEFEDVLVNFTETQMGNFVMFRPKRGRNYPPAHPAPRDRWEKAFDYCVKNDLSFQCAAPLPTMDGPEIERLGGKNFKGFQEHELYLIYQPLNKKSKEFAAWKTMSEAKKMYIEEMERRVSSARVSPKTEIYGGLPDLFSVVYAPETSMDLILCEPVSNISLMLGAARGTGKRFGSHIPPDWYFGFPHDESALRRFSLALHLTYAYGGEVIYSESTLFKTNSHSRQDREFDFCVKARDIVRKFYEFTARYPRSGKPHAPLALIYGNLESVFWLPDDRLPELADLNDWDRLIWGQKHDPSSRLVWKASEAWLPQIQIEPLDAHESMPRMLTGSPLGQVDILTPFSEKLGSHKAAAFLGWNTMTEKIYDNLLSFVKNGGALFICGCHFDTRDRMEDKPSPLFGGKISALTGLETSGPGPEIFSGIRSCAVKSSGAERLGDHFYIHKLGKGKVYFGNFHDYPHDRRLVREIQSLLGKIASEIKDSAALSAENPAVFNFNVWESGDDTKVYISNTAWDKPGKKEPFRISFKGKSVSGALKGGESACLKL